MMTMTTGANQRRRVLTLLLTVAFAFLLGASDGATSYQAPYGKGPTGGDRWNYVDAGEDGRMTVGRAYVIPGPLSCPAEGGYANYRVRHRLNGPVRSVVLDYAGALVDPYTIVTAIAWTPDGTIAGSRKIVGPVSGDGSIEVPVRVPRSARTLIIDFGLELTSACPSVDGGTIQFTKVTVGPRIVRGR